LGFQALDEGEKKQRGKKKEREKKRNEKGKGNPEESSLLEPIKKQIELEEGTRKKTRKRELGVKPVLDPLKRNVT